MTRDAVLPITKEEILRQETIAQQLKQRPDCPRSYHIITYGCQMNVHDSETLGGIMERMGMRAEAQRDLADLILFNTCCIRDNAERRAMGNIIFTKEIKKTRPELLVGVCGCMAQQEGFTQRLSKRFPHVDFSFGPGEIYQLPERILMALDGRRAEAFRAGADSTLYEGLPVKRQSPFFAYINIMYGCDNYCSYCIVPYVRGRERSREMGQILKEAEGLVKDGVQEIMLLGQNVNSYGNDTQGPRFHELLAALGDTGIKRLRFMTSNPKDLSDDLIKEMARNPAICPHLHLPAQSGSDRMLRTMNRRYTRDRYLDRVRALRAAMPEIGLSTDLIVAFPGETETDFQDTLSLVSEVRFDSAFTFIYSPRSGTAAAKLPGRIDPETARDRITRLISVQEEITREVFESLVGQEVQVLVDGTSKRDATQTTGKTGRGIACNFKGHAGQIGQIVPLIITGFGSNTLKAKQIKKETI
ncbi:MAG: tRNA (N6-isopentenyl adenosine(37)-C2)-methylthiotransferase MiaB [Clostridiales bacterium]|nr:tRNA (N6-isopentenyl adenosine(37)-C2)-methylthiotransferase MiaB [Clostridiales bacterium]